MKTKKITFSSRTGFCTGCQQIISITGVTDMFGLHIAAYHPNSLDTYNLDPSKYHRKVTK